MLPPLCLSPWNRNLFTQLSTFPRRRLQIWCPCRTPSLEYKLEDEKSSTSPLTNLLVLGDTSSTNPSHSRQLIQQTTHMALCVFAVDSALYSDPLPPLPPPPLALSHTCSCRAQYLPHPPLPTPTHVCACMMCNQTIISKGFNGGPTASSRKAATDPEWELVKVFHYTEQEVDDTFGYDRWQVYFAPTPSFSNGYMPCLGASTK